MKQKLLPLFILFIGFIACAQDDWQRLEKDNYSISYPKHWESSDKKPMPSMAFLLFSEESSGVKDGFRENINLNLEELGTSGLQTESYVKEALTQLKAGFPDAEIEEKGEAEIGPITAKIFFWETDFGGSTLLRFKQYIFVVENKAYILTYSASVQEFEEYQTIADKIIKSFRFNN